MESAVGIKCEPGSAQAPPTESKVRSRLPANAMVLMRVFQSVFYAICYSTFRPLNPDCDSLTPLSAGSHSQLLHLIRWTVDMIYEVGLKYEDRAWFGQGMEVIKFMSRALCADFVPFQERALECCLLELEWNLDEYEESLAREGFKQEGSAGKELKQWLQCLDQLLDLWQPHLDKRIFPYFSTPSISALLSDLRLDCSGDPVILSRLLEICLKVVQCHESVSSQWDSSPNVEELLIEVHDIFEELVERHCPKTSEDRQIGTELEYDGILQMESYWRTRISDLRDSSEHYGEWLDRVVKLEGPSLQSLLSFDISLITEAAKNGLPGFPVEAVYWLLERLLSSCIDPTSEIGGSEWAPGVVADLLMAIYTLSKSCNFFIDIATDNAKEMEPLVLSALSIVHKALKFDSCYDCKSITIAWLAGYLTILQSNEVYTRQDEKVIAFLEDGVVELSNHLDGEGDPLMRLESLKILTMYVSLPRSESPRKDALNIRRLLSQALKRLRDTDEQVRRASLELIGAASPFLTLRIGDNLESVTVADVPYQFKLHAMAAPHVGTFRAKHFQLVMQYLGLGQRLQQRDDDVLGETAVDTSTTAWLERLFHACQTPSILESTKFMQKGKASLKMHEIDSSDDMLMFWALWETARFCILTRLRTPLGTPLQTFEALEQTLDELVKFCDVLGTPGDADLSTEEAIIVLGRLKHFLTFLELLEMQTYNAGEGSLQCPPAPKASILFFHANRKVREDWFGRIRQNMIIGAKFVGGCGGLLTRLTMEHLEGLVTAWRKHLIKDPESWVNDVETTMVALVESLIHLKDPDPILGIAEWWNRLLRSERTSIDESKRKSEGPVLLLRKKSTEEVASPHLPSFDWLATAALVAEGSYEAAGFNFRSYLTLLLEGNSSEFRIIQISTLVKQVNRGYCNLLGHDEAFIIFCQITNCWLQSGDYHRMIEWLQTLEGWRAAFSERANLFDVFETGHHEEYLYAWADMVKQDYGAASETLDTVDECLTELDLLDVGMVLALFRTADYHTLQALAIIAHTRVIEQPFAHPDDVEDLKESCTAAFEAVGRALHLAHPTSTKEILPAMLHLQLIRRMQTVIEHSFERRKTNKMLLQLMSDSFNRSSFFPPHHLHALVSIHSLLQPLVNNSVEADIVKAFDDFRSAVGKAARKGRNLGLAKRMLGYDDLPDPALSFGRHYEYAKLHFADNCLSDAIATMVTGVNTLTHFPSAGDLEAKAYMNLSDWLQLTSWDSVETGVRESLSNLLGAEFGSALQRSPDGHAVTNMSEGCLKKAVALAPTYGKTWLTYAHYWYRQGLKMIGEICSARFNEEAILGADIKSLGEVLTENDPSKESVRIKLKAILDILHRQLGEKDAPGAEEGPSQSALDDQIAAVLPSLSPELFQRVISMIHKLRDRTLDCFEKAANSYFRFLSCGTKGEQPLSDGNRITATLRILRILVKYGADMIEMFAENFQQTPVQPWETVIPQLFARLDHPDTFVRQQLVKLITRIASSAPHLVVYQAVVEWLSDQGDAPLMSQHAHGQILATFEQSGSGVLVTEIRRMAEELQKVTVLWEEMWVNKLAHLEMDVGRRMEKLQRESARLEKNASLQADEIMKIHQDRYNAVIKPVLGSIEKLYEQTIRAGPSTPHEQWFAHTYGAKIEEAFTTLKRPVDHSKPKEGWSGFKKLHATLAKEVQKPRQIALADLSPFLSRFHESGIPMPGLPVRENVITIQSFHNDVYVLPTKTKPKKINLIGSDGRHYTYLFKGLEDLHLDERLQQFLRIANGLLQRDKQCRRRQLEARTYAVIPFGDHFGMIQWVEGATQLFTLYKRWQQRDHAAKMLRKEGEQAASLPPPQRPHEQFYAALSAAFKRHGIPRNAPRRQWPVAVLKEVLAELESGTPGDLIAKELWCSSATPSVWWDKTKTYSRSLAVMSMIGYIIGLGDRHLDNILLDPGRGDIVHIDYNVSFETGRNLRVPETVPFRLTQNLRKGLGLTGVEGSFRIACQNTLRIMRENKEILTTLLEAFVYDPLVDWMKDEADDLEKKLMDLNVNVGLLASRIAEMKQSIENQRSAILSAFAVVTTGIEGMLVKGHRDMHDTRLAINSRVGIEEALAKRMSDCAMWRSQHVNTLRSLQGPILQACLVDAIQIEPANVFPPFSQPLYALGADEKLMIGSMKVDQDLFRLANERNTCYALCLDHLQLYQALAVPIVDVLLNQDFYRRWDVNVNCMDFVPIEANGRATQREDSIGKHAVETLLKNGYAEKSRELSDAMDSFGSRLASFPYEEELSALREETVAFFDGLRTSEIGAEAISSLIRCASLSTLAEAGVLLLALIKDFAQFEKTLPTTKLGVDNLIPDFGAVFGQYPLSPDNFIECYTVGMATSLMMKTFYGVAGEQRLENLCDDETSELLNRFSELSHHLWLFQWRAADTVLPAVLSIVVTDKASALRIGEDVIKIAASGVVPIDQKSPEFQALAEQKQVQFEDLKAACMNQPSNGRNLLLSLEDLFVGLETHVTKAQLPQEATNNRIIKNALFMLKLQVKSAIGMSLTPLWRHRPYNAPQAMKVMFEEVKMLRPAVNEADDPSHEWVRVTDLREMTKLHLGFFKTTEAIKRYLDVCLRETYLKPLAKLAAKLCKFVGSAFANLPTTRVDKTVMALAKSGIPFVDTSRKYVSQRLDAGDFSKENLERLQGLVSSGMKIHLRGLQRVEARDRTAWLERQLNLKKLSMLRFQLIHEKDLVEVASDFQRGIEAQPVVGIRTQLINNIRADIERLMQLQSNLNNVEMTCHMLETELTTFVSWASSNLLFAAQVQGYTDLVQARHTQFAVERQRIRTLLEMCDSLVHFETFRVPSPATEAMDEEIRTLEQMVTQNSEGLAPLDLPDLLLAEDMDYTKLADHSELVIRGTVEARAILDATSPSFEAIHNIVKKVLRFAEAVPQAKQVSNDLQTFWTQWLEASQNLKELATATEETFGSLNRRINMTQVTRLNSRWKEESVKHKAVFDTLLSFAELDALEIAIDKSADNHDFTAANAQSHLMVESGGKNLSNGLEEISGGNVRPRSLLEGFDTENLSEDSAARGGEEAAASQERNAYALNVLNRVAAKLEGRETADHRQMSIAEQVDTIINHAMSADKVSLMYEGWMGWI
ncbi:Serine/threonine-protein kinase smg1 [Borealophlyctis nickersoniae]|nr:Serine/threonine-protein kinase smg1 [Borealophlyctis nickersoniae]